MAFTVWLTLARMTTGRHSSPTPLQAWSSTSRGAKLSANHVIKALDLHGIRLINVESASLPSIPWYKDAERYMMTIYAGAVSTAEMVRCSM